MEKSERLIPENPIAYNTKVLERLLSAERVQVFIEFQVPAVAIRSVTVEREHAGNASFRTDTVIHAVGFEPHSEAAGLLSSGLQGVVCDRGLYRAVAAAQCDCRGV